jgi:zinc protease
MHHSYQGAPFLSTPPIAEKSATGDNKDQMAEIKIFKEKNSSRHSGTTRGHRMRHPIAQSILWMVLVLVFSAPMVVAQIMPVRLPLQQRSELLNGLKVIVVERPGLSSVTAVLVTFAGSSADESGKSGTASLTAKMLLASTAQRKSAQIVDDLAGEGITASSYADYDASWFRMSGSARNVNSLLEHFSDLILNSNFDSKELEQLKETTKAEMIRRRSDAAVLAGLYFQEKLFGFHPYGYPPEGAPFTISDIGVADCLKFYQRFYHPNNALLVLVGGVRAEDVISRARLLWGGWRNIPVPPIFPKPAKQPVGVLIRIADRPGAGTAQIRLGRIGVQRTIRDYYNLEMMNFMLGGEGSSSRLADRLQKKEQLTNAVHSQFEYHINGGAWKVTLSTPSASVPAAIAGVIDEIKKLRILRANNSELAEAAATMNTRLAAQVETNDQVADALAKMEVYNLAFDTYSAYGSHLSRVSPEQVQQTAREYLDPDSLVVVVVGDASVMKEGLEKIGKVEVFPGN